MPPFFSRGLWRQGGLGAGETLPGFPGSDNQASITLQTQASRLTGLASPQEDERLPSPSLFGANYTTDLQKLSEREECCTITRVVTITRRRKSCTIASMTRAGGAL
eukprot:scaffold56045_cov18-Tisochrysis_lutea.AAC.1